MRTFKQQREQFVQCQQSVTKLMVLRKVHRFIHGAPWGIIDSKYVTFFLEALKFHGK
jgi:hypothetical protein